MKTVRPLVLAAAALSAAACSTATPPLSQGGGARPASVAEKGPPASVPLLPDPGPASARPLDPRFARGPERGMPYLRLLLELREQADLHAIMRGHDARALPRSARRRETLAALEDVSGRARAALEPLLDRLVAERTVDYYQFLRFRNRVFVSATPAALETLRALPAVAELIPEYDGVREAQRAAGAQAVRAAPPVPPGDSWGVGALGLPALWSEGIDGRGIIVGILDTGVFGDHQALASGRRGGADWYDPVSGSARPIDTKPHGAQVLACAVGRPVGGRALGAAPGAQWVAALSNQYNSYNNINMSLSADWMLFEARPDVVLGAWGHGKANCDPRDREMLEAFRAAGIVPVFAAGNDGPDAGSAQAPAGLGGFHPDGRGILAVAAVDRHGRIIDASSRGPSTCGRTTPFPDIAGPGWDIPVPAPPLGDSLTLVSGTSFAVGWVGGVVAMMLQVAPEMDVATVEDVVRRTARDLPPAGPDDDAGYGVIDPRAAVDAARAWAATHPPTVTASGK